VTKNATLFEYSDAAQNYPHHLEKNNFRGQKAVSGTFKTLSGQGLSFLRGKSAKKMNILEG